MGKALYCLHDTKCNRWLFQLPVLRLPKMNVYWCTVKVIANYCSTLDVKVSYYCFHVR